MIEEIIGDVTRFSTGAYRVLQMQYSHSNVNFIFTKSQHETIEYQVTGADIDTLLFYLDTAYRELFSEILSKEVDVLSLCTLPIDVSLHRDIKRKFTCVFGDFYIPMNKLKAIRKALMQIRPIELTFAEDIHDDITSSIEEGTHCQICNTRLKVYKRAFNRNLTASLVTLMRLTAENDNKPIHTNDIVAAMLENNLSIGETSRLKFWNLVRVLDSDGIRTAKGSFLLPTELAYEFVSRKTKIPHAVFTYKNKLQRVSEKLVYIDDVKDVRFNLGEVLL